jgi:hypothetical protein
MSETTVPYTTNPSLRSGQVNPPADLREAVYVADLEERVADLELALESVDWRLLSQQTEQEFSRDGLRQIVDMARVFYLKNPIIQRSVDVRKLYVWGQGWSIKAAAPDIQAVLDAFLDDEKNDDVVGSHEARTQLEVELETDGNLFFVFFVNKSTGRVRVRMIPFAEVQEVICNPEDAHDPWYYKRSWSVQTFDPATGNLATEMRTAFYPDWRYHPTSKPDTIGGWPVRGDTPVYHVKIGGFSNWKFGVPEVYDLLDWAKAYKEFLEDWASIVRAYRRFAFKMTTPTSRAVAAAKAKLQTTLGTSSAAGETNPPPLTGSTFFAPPGYDIDPIRTSGATVAAEDGRRLLLMVAAGAGLPETFYGDASIGTLATAKSLDRPTELMMLDRQTLWASVFGNIFDFVMFWAVKATSGPLRGLGSLKLVTEEGETEETVEWNDGVEDDVAVNFPPVLQHDIPAMVAAIVEAVTLGLAGQDAGLVDKATIARILLTTLDVADVDAIVERMFPDPATGAPAPVPEPAPVAPVPAPVPGQPQTEARQQEFNGREIAGIVNGALRQLAGDLS